MYSHLGLNPANGLTGRSSSNNSPGVIATSKFYSLKNRLLVFTPRLADHEAFYLAADASLLVDMLLSRISRLSLEWGVRTGSPTVIFVVDSPMLIPTPPTSSSMAEAHSDCEWDVNPALISTLNKLESGFVERARVVFDRLSTFVKDAVVTNWTFLADENLEDRVLRELLLDKEVILNKKNKGFNLR